MKYITDKTQELLAESAGSLIVKSGIKGLSNAVRAAAPIAVRTSNSAAVKRAAPLLSRSTKKGLLVAGSGIPLSMGAQAVMDPESNSAKLARKFRYGVDHAVAKPLNSGLNYLGIKDENFPMSPAEEAILSFSKMSPEEKQKVLAGLASKAQQVAGQPPTQLAKN